MKKTTSTLLAGGLLAVVLFASAVSAQDANPITYVDVTHGSGGNTTLLDGSVWEPTIGQADEPDGGWDFRGDFGNDGIYQNVSFTVASDDAEDAHPLKTTVSGLAEDTYDVFVYFWHANGSAWEIRASLTEGGELPLFDAGTEGVVQFFEGADATVMSSDLDGGNPFDSDVMVAEGNRRLIQAHLGTFTGTEFSAFIDDGPTEAGGADDRTWYDGVGVAPAPPREIALPFVADFGSVRFIELLEQMTQEPVEVEPVMEGGPMYLSGGDTVTALPSGLAGNLALKTRNLPPEDVLQFAGAGQSSRVDTNVNTDTLSYPLSFSVWVNRFDDGTVRNKIFGWYPGAGIENRGEVEIVPNEDVLRLVWWGGGPSIAVEPPSPNAWVQIGVVITPETARLYVDGVQVGALDEGVEPWDLSSDVTLWIGARHDGSEDSFSGWMKDWVLFDEDIGDEGMQELAAGTLPEGNLLQHFPMNEGEGEVVFDQSPNETHGDLIGPFSWEHTTVVSDGLEFGLGFVTDRDLTVSIAMDENMAVPTWISNGYTNSGLKVQTTAGDFDLWQRDFGARAHVSLPAVAREPGENNRWVILSEGPDAITENPDDRFLTLPAGDWSTGRFFRRAISGPRATSGLEDPLHTASMTARLTNFLPENGFRLTSTVRAPRLQDEGENSIGYLLLGGSEAPIRAEWLPRASGGDSVLRFVDTSDESTLAQEPWTGLVPTATDNDVGASEGASEILYSVGTPVFVEDAESVVFSEDFEAGGEGWTMGADDPAIDDWEIGEPTSGPNEAFDGVNVAATNLDGVYSANTGDEDPNVIKVAWLRSPVIDLREIAAATLRFQEFLDVDTFEIDGEIFHFATVTVLDADTLDEIEVAMYNTQILSWTERELDLSNVTGNRIILEFGLNTDEDDSMVGDGWYIDAVEVTGTGFEIVSLPENLALDGTLYGIPTERAAVDDGTDNHLQFTVTDRGVSGNDGVTVYVAWDVRASGLEPDWLTQDFDRTDHFVGVNSDAGFHRLWAREYADGAQVTLGGASAAGPGAEGLPSGTHNYFVLLGDARPGLETFYTLEATGEWMDGDGTLTFTLTDANGASQSVQAMVSGSFEDRNQFGVAARHPDAGGGTVEHPPIWEVFALNMDFFEAPDLITFDQWRNSNFTSDQIDAGLAEPEASPAGDGIANVIKYALGLPPLEPAAAADLLSIESDQDSPLTLVYQERTDIDRNEIEYIPQVSEDLIVWLEGEPNVVEISRVAGDSPNTEEVRVRGEVSQDALKAFLRLMIRMVE